MNYSNVKITITGHPCSGKSTYAYLISQMLSKYGVDVEIRDSDIYLPIGDSIKKRMDNLSKSLKMNEGRVIIETRQAKRKENIV